MEFPNDISEVPKIVELGPGRSRGVGSVICIDINSSGYCMPEIVGMVGFEAIPLADNSVDKVVANNMMEHLPKAVYIPIPKLTSQFDSVYKESITEGNCSAAFEKYKELDTDSYDFDFMIHRPIIYVFEEVWRILKPGGLFVMGHPAFPSHAAIGDSTHLSLWSESCIPYYCSQCPIYDARFNFECVENKCNQSDFVVTFKKLDKPIINYQKPKNIWRPKPANPENYYKLTLEKVKWQQNQCGWTFNKETKQFERCI